MILNFGAWIFFYTDLISPLNSSAFPCWSWLHTFSMATMYSPTGGLLGTMAKFGLCAKALIWSWVKGVLDRFLTQFFSLLSSCTWLVLDRFFTQLFSLLSSCTWQVLFCLVELLWFPIWMPCNLVWSLYLVCSLCKSLSNFSFCLFRVLKCCFSLPTSINALHLTIHSSLEDSF